MYLVYQIVYKIYSSYFITHNTAILQIMLRLQLNIDVNKNKITQQESGLDSLFCYFSFASIFIFLCIFIYIFSCVGCDNDDVRKKDVINLAVLLLLLYLLYRENSCAILNKYIFLYTDEKNIFFIFFVSCRKYKRTFII